jgi:hypothetical protein
MRSEGGGVILVFKLCFPYKNILYNLWGCVPVSVSNIYRIWGLSNIVIVTIIHEHFYSVFQHIVQTLKLCQVQRCKWCMYVALKKKMWTCMIIINTVTPIISATDLAARPGIFFFQCSSGRWYFTAKKWVANDLYASMELQQVAPYTT